MRVTLIHNPTAGEQEHDRDSLRRSIARAGHRVDDVSSDEQGWRDALDLSPDLVAVAGGDGTVAKVAREMAGRSAPMAVLPLGTANNISRTLGLNDVPLADLVAGWTTARRQPFDLGVALGPWGSFRFVEGVGLGALATIISDLETSDNAPLDGKTPDELMLAVVDMMKAHIARFEPPHLDLRLDGVDVSGHYVMVEAMNIRSVGPNLAFAPRADPGDGLLDVVLVAARDGEPFRAHLARYLQGEGLSQGEGLPQVVTVQRCSRIQLTWTGYDLHLDDEPWPGDRQPRPSERAVIEIGVERHAFTVLVPP
jgi:diacylglycerol kinase (ATP)